jgi:quercetin 2,3-dioxygenase
MITVRRSAERGHADHGWLDAHHTFSFADYYDQRHMGFSALRVLNQDRVQPGRGFSAHPHRDMEIVTYVLAGALEHKDSMGNGSRMHPGEVQFMSAGSGVVHSEFNPSQTEPLHLLQMWVLPSKANTPPRYEQKRFDESERRGKLRRVVSPDGREGTLTIGQDAHLFAALVDGDERIEHALEPRRALWLHVALGSVRANDIAFGPGDGAAIVGEKELVLDGGEKAELVLWDLPPVR